MRKSFLCTSLLAAALLATTLPAAAQDACCAPGGASAEKQHDDKQGGMDMGQGGDTIRIHEGKKDGYIFAFDMMPMPVSGATHHLMVAITSPEGKTLTGIKVGFDVTGPDGSQQKVMAMAMGGAYGANLNLGPKGRYAVRTKAVVGNGASLSYEFAYEVK